MNLVVYINGDLTFDMWQDRNVIAFPGVFVQIDVVRIYIEGTCPFAYLWLKGISCTVNNHVFGE